MSEDDHNLGLKLLVEFLYKEQSRPRVSSEEWQELEHKFGPGMYSEILYLLTQTEFEPAEARDHWYKILDHRRDLAQILDRDPGLEVAICDYYNNVYRKSSGLIYAQVQVIIQKARDTLLDEATGLYNRRFCRRVLQKEAKNTTRYGEPFVFMFMYIDYLREYFELQGRVAGNQALRNMAKKIITDARAIDHVIRYDGEIFAVILPRCDKTQAKVAAERHRQAVAEQKFPGQDTLSNSRLTASVGLAAFPVDADDVEELIVRAGEAVKQARKDGGNRVVSWAG